MSMLTQAQKLRMEQPLLKTAAYIEMEFEPTLELVCDASRPMQHGMSLRDYKALAAAYRDPDTKAWLRKLLGVRR